MKKFDLETALLELAGEGFAPSLIYDDNGKWACVSDGIQNLPNENEPLMTSFTIEPEKFCDTPSEAVALFMWEIEDEEQADLERNANKELYGAH